MTTPLLETHDLQVSVGKKTVCKSLNLKIEKGQIWAVLGSNGAGKTTLLHTLAGLHPTDNGLVDLINKPMTSMRPKEIAQHLGILFQHQIELFPATLLETTLIGRHPYLSDWQWETSADIALAEEALKTVELAGLSQRSTDSLSGGETQRLKVATLIAQDPKIMLLDEPTNHLDLHYQIKILNILTHKIKATNGALIMALHDINLAARYCSHALLINKEGEFQAGCINEILQPNILSKTYGWPIIKHKTSSGFYFMPE